MTFNPNQMKAINFYRGNCAVVATAGSGKTGCLTNRIKTLVEDYDVKPNNILAITFSKKAKDVMTERLINLLPVKYKSVNIETFHSLGYRIIKDSIWKTFKVIQDVDKIRIIDGFKTDADVREVINYIGKRKNNLQSPLCKMDRDEDGYQYNEIYRRYEAEKEKSNMLDFDDMLLISHRLLQGDDIAEKYVDKFKFILCDEAQDMNHAQNEIIKMLGMPNNNAFIVFDPLQAIYQWRGSDNRYVLDFHKHWDNVTVINLDTNYRSTKDIVGFSNNFAKHINDSKHEFYVESRTDIEQNMVPKYSEYEDEFDEADAISEKINDSISTQEYSYKDFCVLSRTNAQLQVFETSLYSAKVPYVVVGGTSFIDKKEIKIILSYLKLSSDIADNEAFEYIYNKPNRWLGNAFMDVCRKFCKRSMFKAMSSVIRENFRFKTGVAELQYTIKSLQDKKWNNVKEQIEFLRTSLDIDKFVSKDMPDDCDKNEKIDNLNALERIAVKYTNLDDFLAHINRMSEENKKSNSDCVKLSTIHKSKGLEFPVVFLVGLNDGILPHYKNENVEEEKRLVYVAITRPERELYCSGTKEYSGKQASKSPFVGMMFGKDAVRLVNA